MPNDSHYPSGMTARDIPGWDSMDVEECLSYNADSSHCKDTCNEIQRMECMKAGHDDGKHWDECEFCAQARLEAEYYKEDG